MIKKIEFSVLAVLSGILFLFNSSVFGQDAEFTQFYANPLYLNPAFAGTARCPRINMNYRNQWPALTGTYVTYNVSYDQHFDGIQGGVGLLVTSDKAGEGIIGTTNYGGIYSYQLNISREFSIRAALQASFIQKTLDASRLTFGDMIDKKYGFIYQTSEVTEPSRQYPDFSAGLLAYGSKVYGGIAVHHLTEPPEGFIVQQQGVLPKKITVHVGAMLPLDKNTRTSSATYLSPGVLYQQQGKFQQLNLGLYVAKNPLVGGIWYRHAFENPDALIVLLGVQQGMFKFGYSYDVTVSKLASSSGGSHEVSFSIQFECKVKRKKFRKMICPSF